jgi:hypothetical protein
VQTSPDLTALASYYNTTLTQIALDNLGSSTFLLDTFNFVNVPSSLNATAQTANADLTTAALAVANATALLGHAESQFRLKQYVNASILVTEGCAFASQANKSIADFRGPRTANFAAAAVPVGEYS